jgi:hypothetical protein
MSRGNSSLRGNIRSIKNPYRGALNGRSERRKIALEVNDAPKINRRHNVAPER